MRKEASVAGNAVQFLRTSRSSVSAAAINANNETLEVVRESSREFDDLEGSVYQTVLYTSPGSQHADNLPLSATLARDCEVTVPGAGLEVNKELATVLMEFLEDGASLEDVLSMKEAMVVETLRSLEEKKAKEAEKADS